MSEFRVSVITPVYNAAAYVEKAVESAVHLITVSEIILVEDASPDNALEICKQLVAKYDKVKLYRHPNGENRGAGASRNLGIEKSTSPFIAFLDADDCFLPNRFETDEVILRDRLDSDGVYNPTGVVFYSEEGKTKFMKAHLVKPDQLDQYQTQLNGGPGEVYWRLIQGRYGYCHTAGITLRRDVFKKAGLFNTQLRLHQDTDLWIRIAYHHKLVEGASVPVALRGVHSENRIHKANRLSKFKYQLSLFQYFKSKPIPFQYKVSLYKKMVAYHPDRKHTSSKGPGGLVVNFELAILTLRLLPHIFIKHDNIASST